MNIMILGGYGTFGRRIAELLVRDGFGVTLVGRNAAKLAEVKARLGDKARVVQADITQDFPSLLARENPKVVIHTVGPFQNADYSIARACIAAGVHYIDLADAREYVTEFHKLDDLAKSAGVTAISGASTVPALSSAVLDHLAPEFDEMHKLRFGITPGHKIDRGLATTRAILSYVGKPLKPCAGFDHRYGWQDIYRQDYPDLGKRWMANCEVPDLDLLPPKYGLKSIQFSAGMELSAIHFGIWAMGWMRRIGIPMSLEKMAPFLLGIANRLKFFGSDDGAMHVEVTGIKDGKAVKCTWFIIGLDGDGPFIPCAPAVVLAKKLMTDTLPIGARAAVSLVTLEDYLAALEGKKIYTREG